MKDTIIVSGGDIQRDFALDFLRNRIERTGREKLCLIAADRGLEFFMENHLLPDVAVGDFDSLSPQGEEFLKDLSTVEVIRLKPEKDDSDTQCAVNLAIRRGTKRIEILGATGRRVDHLIANLGLSAIIQYSLPVLMFLYPLAITLILLTLFSKWFQGDRTVYAWVTGLTLIAAVFDFLKALPKSVKTGLHLDGIVAAAESYLPLFSIGLGWVLPAAVGLVIGLILYRKKQTA